MSFTCAMETATKPRPRCKSQCVHCRSLEVEMTRHRIKNESLSVCFLALFGSMEHGDPMAKCDGRLVRCHLIPKRFIKDKGGKMWDQRAWVWACGGPMGNGGHHGMLDSAKTLRLPRSAIPSGTEEYADELGLSWWLDKEYGERDVSDT